MHMDAQKSSGFALLTRIEVDQLDQADYVEAMSC
jgi:hypothetical protein